MLLARCRDDYVGTAPITKASGTRKVFIPSANPEIYQIIRLLAH